MENEQKNVEKRIQIVKTNAQNNYVQVDTIIISGKYLIMSSIFEYDTIILSGKYLIMSSIFEYEIKTKKTCDGGD